MDRPLDELIKEKQQKFKIKQNTNNRSEINKNSDSFKGKLKVSSHGSSNRQDRRQEPYQNQRASFPPTNPVKREITREQPKTMTFAVNNQPKPSMSSQQSSSVSKVSIFERIGNGTKPGSASSHSSGTSVTISNINNDVTLADLSELCGAVGEILGATFNLTAQKAKKIANVIFARRSDALTFVQKFHNLPLDGVPLSVCLTGDNGKENPFNPVIANSATTSGNDSKNVRAGLFGTKMNQGNDYEDEDANEDEEQDEAEYDNDDDDDQPVAGHRFTITMKGDTGASNTTNNRRPHSTGGSGGFSGGRPQQQRGRESGGGGSGNGGASRRGGGGGALRGGDRSHNKGSNHKGGQQRQGKPQVSASDLDNALDSYFATK